MVGLSRQIFEIKFSRSYAQGKSEMDKNCSKYFSLSPWKSSCNHLKLGFYGLEYCIIQPVKHHSSCLDRKFWNFHYFTASGTSITSRQCGFFFGRLWCTFVNFEISSESPVDVKESCTTMVSYFDLKFRLYLTTSIYTEYYGLKTTYSTPLKWTIWIHFLPRILFFLDEGEQFYKRFNRMKSSQYNRRVCLDVLGWQSFCSQSS